ncbi:TonB-dependent receptor [Shewanella surugensis]|uniref:TonB-dependent receptor n=1 Tax=Shewanella surugensis TaxID=212020 RepID=A0ABT0LAW5_9GAMM|nr:TonB-dependent receptor [Shewanella surugensis]MCL1124853.1 TonB-dependent receptor [Shewanella surugensis]
MLRLSSLSIAILSALIFPSAVFADEGEMEVIEVKGRPQENFSIADPSTSIPQIDVSDLLDKLPGAAVNGNGPLTGIAQYRGLFGDRVNTQINGVSLAGAGPNAMDTPLSYASLILTEGLSMTRGIAPVSAGIDTLGGNIEVIESKATFDDTTGEVAAQYQTNGDRGNLGGKVNLGNKDQAVLLYVDKLKGNTDITTGNGDSINPTTYNKTMVGGEYRLNLSDNNINDESIAFGYQFLETTNAGTPALPMDIDFIRDHRFKVEGEHYINSWDLNWHMAYSDAKHGMDNYSLRDKPDTSSARYNNADSNSFDSEISIAKDAWLLGLDARLSQHNSLISDPTNASFYIDNFNDVQDDVYSIFAQWQQDIGQWNWQFGSRIKNYRTDSGTINSSMASSMTAVQALVDDFNNSDRSQVQTGLDLTINGQYQFNDAWTGIIGLARKQDAASYQERYLWIPMQSTGGLADGRTYVGQVDLDLETAYQLELGVDYDQDKWQISPRAFVNRIDNYIQGTPATDPNVIAVAAMMGDDHPMQFSNVDALLYGMDLTANYQLSRRWEIDLLGSYVRGERRDIDDNLYRIAPLKASLGLNFQQGNWIGRLEGVANAAQNKVSETQLEETTAGYALINISAGYDVENWTVRAGINNLFDTEYEDHLAGYNRVSSSDIAFGSRMPGMGLTTWVTGAYRF